MSRQLVVSTALLKPDKWCNPGENKWYVLMTMRADGSWHLHGGGVRPGEQPRDAARRETMEAL